LVGFATLAVVAAGCGGGSHPDGAGALAARACQTHGADAASLADQAATKDPTFATLAADERAAAAAQSQQQGVLSDGDAGDDSSTAALVGSQSLGTTAGQRVLNDCVALGLTVLPGHR
jgi:hypothetical protein